MMEKAGHGVNVLTSISLTTLAMVGFAFVNDTDLFLAGKIAAATGKDMMVEFQEALDRWLGGLIGTGGALSPSKSFCYLIDFVWTGDDWAYHSLEDLPGEFTLMDKNGNRDPLRRHEVYYVEKILGVFISMDGNEDTEMTRLKAHSKLFANQIRTAKCSKNAALYTYNASFMKTIEYAMPDTQFSEVDWNRIAAPALEPSLQKAGMVAKFPRRVLYRPDLYQGFQVTHPYFNQEIFHIMTRMQESLIYPKPANYFAAPQKHSVWGLYSPSL